MPLIDNVSEDVLVSRRYSEKLNINAKAPPITTNVIVRLMSEKASYANTRLEVKKFKPVNMKKNRNKLTEDIQINVL